MEQVFQVGGSVLVLIPFVLVQLRRMRAGSIGYLLVNVVGSAVLAVDAGLHVQWGFLLLEGVWALVSLGGLLAIVLGRAPTGTH